MSHVALRMRSLWRNDVANFTCIVDSDTERRTAYISRIRDSIAPLPKLQTREAGCGSFHVVWACADHAPVDVFEGNGQIAVVWGRPLPKDGSTPVQAVDVASAWASVRTTVPEAWDGYFAAVAFDEATGLVAGVDVLGLMPMFWWSSGDVVLCGTSPEPFRSHPLFRVRLDRLGLTGILLTAHSVGGRTLLEGVRRQGQGNLFHAAPGGPAREIVQYRLPLSTQYYDMPIEEHVTLFEEAMDRAVRRHVPSDTPHALLLSGGMDSRIVASLSARHGVPVKALTFGLENDVEMHCARAVAKALHFEHHFARTDMQDGAACAERHARLLHASSGLHCIEYWGVLDVLQGLAPRWTGGYNLDIILGGNIARRIYSKETRTQSFENMKPYIWSWGIPPDTICALLAFDDVGDMIAHIVDELRAVYEGYHELESHRYWAFNLNQRHRLLIGQVPWIFSFGAWPSLIGCDRVLLETAGGMPMVSLDERLLETQLIRRRFPDMARLPLDRNSMNYTPIIPNWKALLNQRVEWALRPYVERFWRRGQSRSQYHRAFDFNNAGWRQARRHTDRYRSAWDGIFNMEALNGYLPGPEVDLETVDVYGETSGRKTLLGLLLWGRDYL